MPFPRIEETPGTIHPDTLRFVRIGDHLTGFTYAPTSGAEVNMHTSGKEREFSASFSHIADTTHPFVCVTSEVRVKGGEKAEFNVYLHTAEDAQALLEAVEAAHHALRHLVPA